MSIQTANKSYFKSKTRRFTIFILFTLFTLFSFRAVQVFAFGSNQVNFQGKVTDINGINVPNGSYNFRVRIYNNATASDAATNLKYTEDLTVTVTNGIFNLKFTPTIASIQNTDTYVQVCFNSVAGSVTLDGTATCGATASSTGDTIYDKVFSPRKKLTSNPYSLISKFLGSSLISGDDSGNLTVGNNLIVDTNTLYADATNNRVGVGTATPSYKLDLQSGNTSLLTASTRLLNIDTNGTIYNTTAGPLTNYGAYIYSSSSSNAGSFPLTNIGIYARAESGKSNSSIQVQTPGVGGGTGGFTNIGIEVLNSTAGFNTSGIINNYGLKVNGQTGAADPGGTVNNYGIFMQIPEGANTGTTNNYGLYLAGSAASNRYSIYSESDAKSYFAGSVGIGTTPTYKLDVNAGTSLRGINVSNVQAVDNNLYGVYSDVQSSPLAGYTYNQYGGYFKASGSGSIANSIGVYGESSAGDVNEYSVGVQGLGATGVYGTSNLALGGVGVSGETSTTNSIGVAGSSSGTGGIGGSFASTSSTGKAIYATQTNSLGYSIYSIGGKSYFEKNVGIGDLTPTGKQLSIKGNVSQALTGTISIANNSDGVTGTGTSFTTEVNDGDSILLGSQIRIVDTVNSNTSITLTTLYTGSVLSGVIAYVDPTALLNIADASAVDKLTFTRTGSLGIGTSTPLFLLDVNGTTRLNSTLSVTGASTLTGLVSVSTLGSANTNTSLCRNGSGQVATCSNSFLTAEADTLASVTGRGATTTSATTFNNTLTVGNSSNFVISSGTGTYSQTYTGTSSAFSLSTSSVTSATTFSITSNGLTTGKGLSVASSATGLTSGSLTEISLTGDNASNAGNLLRLSITGTSTAAKGLMITNLGTGESLRINDETGDADATPFVINSSGSVGIGTASPSSLFSVGSSSQFQVNSTGGIAASTGYVQSSGTFAFTSATTTGNLFSLTENSITSGNGFNLSSTATAFTGTLANISLSGNSASNTGTLFKVTSSGASNTGTLAMITNAGTGLLFRVNDDGTDTDSTPVTIDADGNLGLGIADAVTYPLHIHSTGTGQFLQLTTAASGTANLDGFLVGYSDSIGGRLIVRENNGFEISTNAVTRYAIDTSGNSDITGTLQVNLTSSTNSFALCHETNGASNDQIIKDCSGLPIADYMEMYPVSGDATIGDIVSVGTNSITTINGDTIKQLVKSSSQYQTNVIGIVSDKSQAGDFNSIGYNIEESDNPQPIALNGRVKVKVTSENGNIMPGDLITTSTKPGVGMKSTAPGFIVGKALEEYSSSDVNAVGYVMVYVNNTYYNPNTTTSAIPQPTTAPTQSPTPSPTTAPNNDSTTSYWTLNNNILSASYDTSINGNLNAKKATFDSLYTELINIGNGKATIDANGDILSAGSITAALIQSTNAVIDNLKVDKLSIDSTAANPTVGTGTVLANAQSVVISNPNVTSNSKVLVTITSDETDAFSITKNPGTGFTLKLKTPNTQAITFDYWVIGE